MFGKIVTLTIMAIIGNHRQTSGEEGTVTQDISPLHWS